MYNCRCNGFTQKTHWKSTFRACMCARLLPRDSAGLTRSLIRRQICQGCALLAKSASYAGDSAAFCCITFIRCIGCIGSVAALHPLTLIAYNEVIYNTGQRCLLGKAADSQLKCGTASGAPFLQLDACLVDALVRDYFQQSRLCLAAAQAASATFVLIGRRCSFTAQYSIYNTSTLVHTFAQAFGIFCLGTADDT